MQQHVTNGHLNQKALVLDEDDQEMSDPGDLADGPLKSVFDTSKNFDTVILCGFFLCMLYVCLCYHLLAQLFAKKFKINLNYLDLFG